MDGDELGRIIDDLLRAMDVRTVAEMERLIDAEPAIALSDEDVILLGFEDSVDMVYRWQGRRPHEIRRPMAVPRRHLMVKPGEDLTKPPPWREVAIYERVGDRLYRRTS